MKWQHIAIVGVWVTATAIAFVYFTGEKLKAFDPANRLAKFDIDNIESELVTQFSLNLDTSQATLIQFYHEECGCNGVSNVHAKNLAGMAKQHGIKVIRKPIEPGDIVPSAPSAILLDKEGKLVYLGPYGAGVGCSQINGFAATVLNNYLKGFSEPLIVNNVRGCYCNIKA